MLINRKKENATLPISVLVQIWIRDNIFYFPKGDSAAYLALYIMIPVIITLVFQEKWHYGTMKEKARCKR